MPERKRWPSIPRKVMMPGGPVVVVLTRRTIRHENSECWGLYDIERRTITIDVKAEPRQRWRTFYHELTHVAVIDSGLANSLRDNVHEALCDAMATARMRERFG
jgi:Zn-dependent peptidase ImmA (M78 family)